VEQKPTAIPVWISELLSGRFTQQEDSPSAIVLSDGRTMQRVRLYGIIVSTNEIIIDDGTGSILVRSFEAPINAQVGAPALVIGRPREYNGQQYILGEIIKTIHPGWLQLRNQQKPAKTENPLDIVRTLDTGEGAEYDEVVKRIGTKGEEIIVHLLSTGELFETKPGRLKLLE
jgi:hypothetical protein